jgi:hypothetical protein
VCLPLLACGPVPSTIDDRLAQATPQVGTPTETRTGDMPHCELVNGPRGCTDAVPISDAGAPGGTRTSPVPRAFTPRDCAQTGWAGVALVYGNLGRMQELSDYCRAIEQARAVHGAGTPIIAPSPAGTASTGTGGVCTMTPTCQRELAARDRLLASYSAQMAGRGVGAQYGYAWCAATESERAARACAVSLRAAGQAACAAQVETGANSARQTARQALVDGRAVGIDASRAVACR